MPGCATVHAFPLSPRLRIRGIVGACPALAAIAERLPGLDDPRRPDCERALAAAFTRLLHLPRISYEEAVLALDHDAPAGAVVVEELGRMYQDPERRELYELWSELWSGLEEGLARDALRYFLALIARLYRLEPVIRSEADA